MDLNVGLQSFDNHMTWGCSLIGACRFSAGRSSLRNRHSHLYLQPIGIDLRFLNLLVGPTGKHTVTSGGACCKSGDFFTKKAASDEDELTSKACPGF